MPSMSASLVRFGTNRRVHFEASAVNKIFITQNKIMRCSFTCYVEAFRFCLTDKINGLLCRNMANMVWTSALTDKLNIACNRAPSLSLHIPGQEWPVGVVPVMNASTANKTVVFACEQQ